jgi:transposase-like protein
MLYRVSAASRRLGVSASSLRRWERLGILPLARRLGNCRVYSEQELRKIKEAIITPPQISTYKIPGNNIQVDSNRARKPEKGNQDDVQEQCGLQSCP